ncbi:hypothetical protein CDAR_40101 [Caerostris darwini]|uniref:Uncharacterized protein n=1 Tax=Caerostris darwini TaxID=1538125 RepID=A0AAV4RAV0_9ARAC|nr:hypothetical protein CDAR_40101 [Caerostris darwini]
MEIDENTSSSKCRQKKPRTSDTDEFSTPLKHLIAKAQAETFQFPAKIDKNSFNPLSKLNELEPNTEANQLKPKLPAFLITPDKCWSVFFKNLKSTVHNLKSSLSTGHFLKLTVGEEAHFNSLKSALIIQEITFKTFNLKKDQPLKVVLIGLTTCPVKEEIKADVSALNFSVLEENQLKEIRSKRPI